MKRKVPYRAGERYTLAVSLRRGEMETAGFQLAARLAGGAAAGRQAGALRAIFHLAANAGNGDGSQLGDLVYATSRTSRAP